MKQNILLGVFVTQLCLYGCGGDPSEQGKETAPVQPELATSQHPLSVEGSGYIYSDWDRIRYDVQSTGDPNKVTIVLVAAPEIYWWKSISIFSYVNGSYQPSKRIETRDDYHYAAVDYFEFEATSPYMLEFWKAGFWGYGRYVTSLSQDRSTLGKKITFTWERD